MNGNNEKLNFNSNGVALIELTQEEMLAQKNQEIQDLKEKHLEDLTIQNERCKKDIEKIQGIYKEEIKRIYAACKAYNHIGTTLVELLLKYGDHLKECDIWEVRLSGRLLDMPESEICTCGLSTYKSIIDRAKQKILTSEEMNAVLQEYME